MEKGSVYTHTQKDLSLARHGAETVISVIGRLRPENHGFETSLGYISCLRTANNLVLDTEVSLCCCT